MAGHRRKLSNFLGRSRRSRQRQTPLPPTLLGLLLVTPCVAGCSSDVSYTELDESRPLSELSQEEKDQLGCEDYWGYIGHEYGIDEWWRGRCLRAGFVDLMVSGSSSACAGTVNDCLEQGPPDSCEPSALFGTLDDFAECGLTVGDVVRCGEAQVESEMSWLAFDCDTSLVDDWPPAEPAECEELYDRCE